MPLSDALRDRARTVVPTAWIRAARLDNAHGQEARLAVEILTECQYKDGARRIGPYTVPLRRGQTLVSVQQVCGAMGVKNRRSGRRALRRICEEMGWDVRPLRSDEEPGDDGWYPGQYTGTHPGTHPGTHLGTLITVCNYDALTRLGNGAVPTPVPSSGGTRGSVPVPTSHSGSPIQEKKDPVGSSSKSGELFADHGTKTQKVMSFAALSRTENAHLLEGDTKIAVARRAFVRLCRKVDDEPNTMLTDRKVRAVRALLSNKKTPTTEDEIMRAVDSCAASPFHRERHLFDLAKHVCKDREQIEMHLRKARGGGRNVHQHDPALVDLSAGDRP